MSKVGLLAGGFSVRITLLLAGTVKEPQRLLNTLPPAIEEWSSTETLSTVTAVEPLLSSLMAPAS